MKLATVFVLLALVMVVPAFAAESAPPPAPQNLSVSSAPACPSTATQNGELPSWLTGEPLRWSGESELPSWLSAGCAAYCRTCDGCCAILGPNTCACC